MANALRARSYALSGVLVCLSLYSGDPEKGPKMVRFPEIQKIRDMVRNRGQTSGDPFWAMVATNLVVRTSTMIHT